jgi:hypothetical protein
VRSARCEAAGDRDSALLVWIVYELHIGTLLQITMGISISYGMGRQGEIRDHYIFSCRDVDLRTKYNIHVTCPLNALLWGCETWNLSAKTLKKLEAFHHGAARRILAGA